MLKAKKRSRHTLFIIFGLSFSLINFAVFWLYINLDTIISTFTFEDEYVYLKEMDGAFYYYKNAFRQVFLGENEWYSGAFGHTMIAMLINVIIFPLALLTAYAFYKRVYGEKFFRVMFYLPSIIAITTIAMCFSALFNEYPVGDGMVQGPIAVMLRNLFGYSGESISLTVTGTPGTFGTDNFWSLLIFFSVFIGLGTNVVLMCGAMMRIPKDVTEALRIDGCGFFKEMFRITIPMIMPTITTWIIMIVTSVFGFSIAPMVFAGVNTGGLAGPAGQKINTIPLIIYANANGNLEQIRFAQALGVIFSLIMMPIVLLVRWLCEKFTPDISY